MKRTFKYEADQGDDTFVERAITLDTDDLKLTGDLDADSAQVANAFSQIVELSAMFAAEGERLDANYRAWRAERSEAAVSSGDKIPEWRVKNLVEADPGFDEHKAVIAENVERAEFVAQYREALRLKAQLLRIRVDASKAKLDAEAVAVDTRTPRPTGKIKTDESDNDGRRGRLGRTVA